MRRVSSHSSLSGAGAGGGSPAGARRLSRDSRNASAQSLTDLVAAAVETAMAPSVVSHTIECYEQYGFPETTLQPRALAECLATPEHQAEAAAETRPERPPNENAVVERIDRWLIARREARRRSRRTGGEK